MNIYKQQILDHYRNPRNYRKIADYNASARLTNTTCGDEIEMYLRVKDGKVEDIGFQGSGCALSIACSSMLTELVQGLPLARVELLGEKEIEEMVGQVNPGRKKCVMLPLEVLKAAVI
ncbi:iron-sulfur cluster assembly scaffold protein [Patescibacteria group bacterium]|nr:iron-sulfur cluster assembly scaffold protein [Patescibacteria group bacterium]MBU1868328.1 iron-sulfur cluster assembly scaffold protein [Patescibacteria group bacterium]